MRSSRDADSSHLGLSLLVVTVRIRCTLNRVNPITYDELVVLCRKKEIMNGTSCDRANKYVIIASS